MNDSFFLIRPFCRGGRRLLDGDESIVKHANAKLGEGAEWVVGLIIDSD